LVIERDWNVHIHSTFVAGPYNGSISEVRIEPFHLLEIPSDCQLGGEGQGIKIRPVWTGKHLSIHRLPPVDSSRFGPQALLHLGKWPHGMLDAMAHDDASTACRPRVSPQQSRTTPNGALKRRPHGRFFSMAIKAPKTSIHPRFPTPTANISSI